MTAAARRATNICIFITNSINRQSQERFHMLGHFPRIGEQAPDFALRSIDGVHVHLVEYPKPVALVFLRHLG